MLYVELLLLQLPATPEGKGTEAPMEGHACWANILAAIGTPNLLRARDDLVIWLAASQPPSQVTTYFRRQQEQITSRTGNDKSQVATRSTILTPQLLTKILLPSQYQARPVSLCHQYSVTIPSHDLHIWPFGFPLIWPSVAHWRS